MNIADDIQKLNALRESGALSDVEFEQAKARLLNTNPTTPSSNSAMNFIHKMGRSRTDNMLGGVCGGLATQTALPAWVWRLIFASAFLFSFGSAGLIYVLLWWLMPYND